MVIKKPHTLEPSKVSKLFNLQGLRPIHEIWKIETSNVITDDNIGIHLFNKVSPTLKHLTLILEGYNLRSNNVSTCI